MVHSAAARATAAETGMSAASFLSFIDFLLMVVADHCRDDLGAAAGGSLDDHQFSASSSYDEASVGPEEARYVLNVLLTRVCIRLNFRMRIQT